MKSNYNIPCISIEDYENMKRKLSHITAHISPFENYIEDDEGRYYLAEIANFPCHSEPSLCMAFAILPQISNGAFCKTIIVPLNEAYELFKHFIKNEY